VATASFKQLGKTLDQLDSLASAAITEA
jgi:hypothetical protein